MRGSEGSSPAEGAMLAVDLLILVFGMETLQLPSETEYAKRAHASG